MDIKAYIQSGAIESYVLGLASPEEAAELLRMRDAHPEVAAALAESERWLNDSARMHSVPPAPGVKEKLFDTLKTEFRPPLIGEQHASNKRSSFIKYLAAASIILFLGSVALNLYFYNRYATVRSEYLALLEERNTMLASNTAYKSRLDDLNMRLQAIAGPDVVKVVMPGVAGRENTLATVYWDTKSKDVYLISNNLPKAPAGKQYQLWALLDGKPVDAGVLPDCEQICRLKSVNGAQAFAITLEQAGGSPAPTLDQMYVFGNVKKES